MPSQEPLGRRLKARSLDEAEREALGCERCTFVSCTSRSSVVLIPLVAGRTQVVFGAGGSNADLMFVGEAPGKDEDERGEPFIGKDAAQAGRLLDERLRSIGVSRDEVFLTNIVMCRPTKVVNGRPPSNRHPCKNEIENCAHWLDEQVRLVKPKLVVPLGVRPVTAILGRGVLMRQVHGKPVSGQESVWKDPRITIIPTYHPAGIRGSAEKRQAFEEDFETIGDHYQLLKAESGPNRSTIGA